MLFCLLSFSLGTIVLHCTSWLLPQPEIYIKVLIFLLSTFLLVSFLLCYEKARLASRISMSALAFGLGFSYASLEASQHIEAMLKQPLSANVQVQSSRVCSLVRSRKYYEQVDMCFEEDVLPKAGAAQIHSGRYRLSFTKGLFKPDASVCWSLDVVLKPPRSTYNPWVGSFERHLFYQRVLGVGRIVSAKARPCQSVTSFASVVLDFRQTAQTHLQALLYPLQHPGLIEALVLGEKAKISPEENLVLAGSGTQHLMAISGLHVGLVCWFAFALLRALSMRRTKFMLVALVGLLYVLFVGFSPSAQRAWVMVLCALVIVLGYAPRRPYLALSLALVLVLMLDPLAPLSAGFWLSFSAVAALILMSQLSSVTGNESMSWWQVLNMQVGLLVFLLFAQSVFGMPLSGLAWIANLVAIPWVSFVVLPLSLLSFALSYIHEDLAQFGFQVADAILDFLLAFLGALSDIDWSWRLPDTPWLKFIVFGLLLLALLARFNVLMVLGLGLSMLALLSYDRIPINAQAQESSAQLWVLDSGQGLSLVASSGQQLWVYDTGPAYERFSVARSVLSPLLEQTRSDRKLTGVVLSHGDADHAGDYGWLLEHFSAAHVWLGEPQRTPVDQSHKSCVRGQYWADEGSELAMRVEVLWPHESYHAKSSNNHSCVVRFTLGEVRFLVMGDLESEGELAMLRWLAENNALDELRSEVLVAGHHGAQAASSMRLLKQVQPSYVVFSAGYLNRFKHPSVGARSRVKRISARALNTAETGAIRFSVQSQSGSYYLAQPYLSRTQVSDYWVLK